MIKWAFELIRKYQQFIKFCFVGVLNTIVDFAVLNIFLKLRVFSLLLNLFGLTSGELYDSLSYLIPVSLGVIAGATNSYLWNRFWVFRHVKSTTKKTLPRFIITFGIFMIISLTMVWVLRYKAGFSENMAKLISVPFTMTINYFLTKLFTFRDRKAVK